MSPEEWRGIGELVSYFASGIGGTIAAQKLHAKVTRAAPSDLSDTESAMLTGMDALGDKIERLSRGVGSMRVEVNGLHQDVQRNGQDIERLTGRMDALEARSSRPT